MSQRDIEPSHLETLDRDLGRVSSLELATAYVAKAIGRSSAGTHIHCHCWCYSG